jgi:hypothetical protein
MLTTWGVFLTRRSHMREEDIEEQSTSSLDLSLPRNLSRHPACEPGYSADSARAEWWDGHSSCVDMGHRDDDVALFVSGVDIPVSLGNVFQRIASINDRFYLSRLNQLFEDQ